MLLGTRIKLAPSNVSKNVDQLHTCTVSQATTPPSMTGTKVACKNGTRIALSHNPMKGGFFASTLGLDDIAGYLSISKTRPRRRGYKANSRDWRASGAKAE